MVAPQSTAGKQFAALWLKQWRLTRRSYLTCAWNIVLPVIILGAVLGLERFLNSQVAITRPTSPHPSISPAWYLYQSDDANSTFVPPASFLYASSASVNASEVGTFDQLSTGLLGAAYMPEAWVKFVEFDEDAGRIQPKEILNPDFNFSFTGIPSGSESELLSTLWDAFKAERPPSYVAAYSIANIDFVNRIFSFDVFVNGSLSRYADLATATALLDQGISMMLNATVPGVMRFLGYKVFPFLGGKINELDIATTAGPFFFLILLSMLFPVFVNLIVYEKEQRLTQLMKMNGLRMSMYWLVNYVFCYALYFAVMIAFLIAGYALRFRFFTQSSIGVFLILYVLWGFALVSFAFATSTLFSLARTATISCYFWIILTALVANFLIENWVRDLGKQELANIVSLVPPWALYRAMVYIAMQTEFRGPGVDFSGINNSEMNIAACYGYLVFHAIFFLLLALYLEEVLPSEFGVKRHPLFFLQKSYWQGKGDAYHRLPNYEPVESEPVTVAAERANTFKNEKSYAVRVLNLRKEYPNGKVAVSNVALNIEPGVCLGLLGSNGAGKTTLISMLCGLFPPTSGDAVIDNLSIRTSMSEIHRRIGVCPQMNVLWENLTGKEHLYFFGRLKGLTGDALEEAVRNSLEGVRLWPARNKLSKKYSGGMKRRLSVAISLIADPRVVFLDEPSTGLDPASRQTLWECIRASKIGKAMVLTTHSMEEAEALCDRHAVFSDGSLRAVGLAAELKAMYAPSLRLALNLKRDSVQRDDALDRFIMENFPAARPDSSKAIAEFRTFMLPSTARLSEIFNRVDRGRDALCVADWAVSNATLEEVFFAVVRIARLSDVRQADGTWLPSDACAALAQYANSPVVPTPQNVSDKVWGLALVAAYFTSQPEVEQSEWRPFATSLSDALRANNVEPALVNEARATLHAAQLLFQG